MYLVSSGIGEIVLIDHDEVEISNLQRQIIFQTGDIGKKKAKVAREVLQRLNPKVKIDTLLEESKNARLHYCKGLVFILTRATTSIQGFF